MSTSDSRSASGPRRSNFDVNRADVERVLEGVGHCEAVCIHEFTDDNGDVRGAELKLNVICRAPVVQGWRISLKLHRIRVDGIDHEGQYDLPDGSKAHGWHRHVWDEKAQHGDDLKQPLETFGKGLQSKAEFLIRACREMRIIFNKSDDGNGILQFD